MPRRAGNTSSGKVVARAERDNKALELRKAGMTLAKIAEKCGYSNAQRAQEAIVRKIKEIPRQNAEDMRTIETERLDRMQFALWKDATSGDNDAIQTILKLMARRAKLLGIDAPLAVDLTKADEDVKAIREHLGDIPTSEGQGPAAG